MERWFIQIATFLIFSGAMGYGLHVYRKNGVMKIIFPFILVWVAHSFIFATVLVIRIIYCRGEPAYNPWIIWWANLLQLHGGIAALYTFISLSSGGRAIPPE